MPELYSTKDPLEAITCSMDFTNSVASLGGGVISACVVDVTRVDGKTEDTTAMVSGGCDLTSAPIIKQRIAGGTHGVNYLVRFKATLGTQFVVGAATMLVKNGN